MKPFVVVAALLGFAVGSPAAADSQTRDIPQYSTWVGSYTCAQGVTAIRLKIETSSSGGAATGLFEFGPHDKNPQLPRGSFWMKGPITRDGRGALSVQLAPDKWKDRPAGWIMVPLRATGDLEDRTLTGTIENESCGAITVQRR